VDDAEIRLDITLPLLRETRPASTMRFRHQRFYRECFPGCGTSSGRRIWSQERVSSTAIRTRLAGCEKR